MKRKRGHKKSKSKHSGEPTNNPDTTTATADDDIEEEDEEDLDNNNNNNGEEEEEEELDSETETPEEEDYNEPLINMAGTGGRVKVKLKTKLPEPQTQIAHSQSDTDKSGSYLSFTDNKQEEVVDKKDTGTGTDVLSVTKPVISGFYTRKTGGIKIKPYSHGERMVVDSTSDVQKTATSDVQKPVAKQESRYNPKELITSLDVIKKIMKMDAAEPFNAPVDPVALGIPDYFDVIQTPMDFGTICNNLEDGHKYKNSEDVYQDVQYIWENCFKYNNKGDYIVDLMKRVKKNFMKYWTAAGLYSNQVNKSNACERLQVGNAVPSSQEGKLMKGGAYMKQKKKGRHGFHKHKSDCLCAVCVVRRRRKEREINAQAADLLEISDGNMSQDFKQEDITLENHYSEDASSNLDRSPDPVEDAETEEHYKKVKLVKHEKQRSPLQKISDEADIRKMVEDDRSGQFQLDDGSGEEPNRQFRSEEMEESPTTTYKQNSEYDTPPNQKEETAEMLRLQQRQDALIAQQQTIMRKNLLIDGNPTIMKLCGSIFPSDKKSVWSGPHSLCHQDVPVRHRRKAIHSALESFMK